MIALSRGNFDLHKNYLDGLLNVSATVKRYPKVQSIVSHQSLLTTERNDAYKGFVASAVFSGLELLEIKSSFDKLINESVRSLDELTAVVTPGVFRMSDGERVESIDRIDAVMIERVERLRLIIAEKKQLVIIRAQQKRDVRAMKILTGAK